MSRIKKALITVVLAPSFWILLSGFFFNIAQASTGITELRSQTDRDYRCIVYSMKIGDYKVLVNCVNLIFPGGSYILWGNALEDGDQVKIGDIEKGSKSFSSKTAFSGLFITLEKDLKTKSPSGPVVMSGVTQAETFLNSPTTPTPSPEGEEEKTAPVEAVKEPSTRDKLLTALKRAGVAALFALVALIGIIFVITRTRK